MILKVPPLHKVHYLCPDWPAPVGVRAFVSTRGGTGQPFNVADKNPHTSQSGTHEVRAQLQADWQLQQSIQWLKQVHGTDVVNAASHYQQTGTMADGLWSDTPDLPCAIMTADCLPVLFCNTQGTSVAAAHAGWRGLAAGILDHTVSALKTPPSEVMAWLGPAISQPCFEVGAEVKQTFMERIAGAEHAFIPSHQSGKWLADLYALARLRLAQLGVDKVYGGHYCTYRQEDYFYSYRRGDKTERIASVIWIQSL